MTKQTHGRIAKVIEGSHAWEAGIRPGDELLSINSQPVRDILDYRFLTKEEQLRVQVRRDGQDYAAFVFKDSDEELGLEFEEELFDGVRKCNNRCIFCFLHQMPKGLRSTLYVQDDDYRLSFAHGNYITLTNLSDEDMERICSQRMSSLYVSVHATEPDLRVRMLGNAKAGRIMEQLRSLADARVTLHTQVVLCPGINDGRRLERTIDDLASLHPRVASIAVVPVGLTKHRARLTPLRPVDRESAAQAMDLCTRKQAEFKRRLGTRLVYPADELYLLSGVEFPDAEKYEGFPQLEDGIGVSRIFLDELEEARESAESGMRSGEYIIVSGLLAAPIVRQLADFLNLFSGVTAEVCVVKNKFLGETVTVAGLLTGRDIAEALPGVCEDAQVLIPAVALNEDRFLDDMTISQLQQIVGARVIAVPPSPRAVVESLAEAPSAVSCATRAGR